MQLACYHCYCLRKYTHVKIASPRVITALVYYFSTWYWWSCTSLIYCCCCHRHCLGNDDDEQCSIIIPFSNKISYLLYITKNSIDTVIYGLYIWHWKRSDRRENLKIRFLNSKDDDLNNADFGQAIGFQKSRNSTSDEDIIYLKI